MCEVALGLLFAIPSGQGSSYPCTSVVNFPPRYDLGIQALHNGNNIQVRGEEFQLLVPIVRAVVAVSGEYRMLSRSAECRSSHREPSFSLLIVCHFSLPLCY